MKVRPLKYYIHNKEEMLNQVFSCIPEKQVRKMIPPVLKDMPIVELKAECLVQLLSMSDSRIINILEGHRGSKEAECRDSYTENKKKRISEISNVPLNKIKTDNASKLPNPEHLDKQVVDNKEEGLNSGSKRKHKEKKHKGGKKHKKSTKELDNDPDNKGKSLLELLELEMRAKAIRSLLKQEEELEKHRQQNKEKKKDGLVEKKLDLLGPKEITEVLDELPERQREDENSIERNYLNEGIDNTTDQKEIYDWNKEEERLIYEDDEYESDEKPENEVSKGGEEENSRSSWAERWLQSKDIKKVVATSKMLSVVRNKMKNSNKIGNKSVPSTCPPSDSVQMEGSIIEYETLHGMYDAVEHDTSLVDQL